MAARPAPEQPPARSPERGTVPQRTDGYPDDLAKIKGVGHAYKQRLYQAGIYTWRQVAETDVETLRAAARANQGANVEEWPAQARALAEKYGRQDATYTGPPPDDLTRIRGIGPVNEEALYRAGICTFEQLANASPQELRSLLPPPVAGEEPDIEDWIRQAAKLANARSRRSFAAP
jgi:predicted flap endonuclease-1-like 5' DNA nuclease